MHKESQAVKTSVQTLIGGADPATPTGQAMVAGLAARAATGLLLGLLSSEKVQETLLFKAGFNDITNEDDKARVLAAYQEFLGILQNADYSSQASLDKALAEADAKFAGLSVTRTVLQPDDPTACPGEEHGDEICRAALFRHVDATALPRRDGLPTLRCHGYACQPEEERAGLSS